MKPKTSKLASGIVSLTLLATTFAPAFAYAKNEKAQNNFCTRLSSLTAKAEERLAENDSKLAKIRSEHDNTFAIKRSNVLAQVLENRSKADENRANRYEKMVGRATTDAQKAALTTFKTIVDQATTARRTAIDAAQTAFRSSTDKILATRKTQLDSALSTYKTALAAAKTKAQTDCTANVDPKTVKTNFETALKAAREQFNTARQNAEKIGPLVNEAAATRKAAVEKATTDFKSTVEKAMADLKLAFTKTSTSTTSTPSNQ